MGVERPIGPVIGPENAPTGASKAQKMQSSGSGVPTIAGMVHSVKSGVPIKSIKKVPQVKNRPDDSIQKKMLASVASGGRQATQVASELVDTVAAENVAVTYENIYRTMMEERMDTALFSLQLSKLMGEIRPSGNEQVKSRAEKYEELARKGDFKALASIAPSSEELSYYMQIMFSNPDVLQQWEQEILKGGQQS